MSYNTYDIGDLIRLTAEFAVEGIDTDPTTLTFHIRRNITTEVSTVHTYGTDVQLVRDDPGQYHVDFIPDEAGDWYYRFVGTGAAQASEEMYFKVRPSQTL